MRTKLLSLLPFLLLLAIPARAGDDVFAARKLRPLLQVHALGATFAGQRMVQDVFLYRTGALLASYTQGDASDGVPLPVVIILERGTASSTDLEQLNQAFGRAQIGLQRGDCGQPIADSFASLQITWYGQKGRTNTFTVGADTSGCPEAIKTIVEAIDGLLTAVRNDPETETFRGSALP